MWRRQKPRHFGPKLADAFHARFQAQEKSPRNAGFFLNARGSATSFPLHHQQDAQTRVVKGIDCDQHGALPSLLPSTPHIFC